MKFIHTADLHIGKIFNEFSLLEDQRFILKQIVSLCKEHHADAIVLAGDIYDRAMPKAEAVELFDEFLTDLSVLGITVLFISGNHDSAVRLSYGSRLFKKQGIHIGCSQDGSRKIVRLTDEYGDICFELLPFVKAGMVEAGTMDEAVGKMLEEPEKEEKKEVRRVLVTHYFVTNAGCEPELSDSESHVYVGGLESVDAARFKAYDYVALGHIHKPQRLGKTNIYYAGSPLKYSFSEAGQTKSVCLVDMKQKGDVTVERLPLVPMRDVRVIRGNLSELVREDIVNLENRDDYIQVILTDENERVDALTTLRSVYPNTMQLMMERDMTDMGQGSTEALSMTAKPEEELFGEFYGLVTGKELEEEKAGLVKSFFEKLRGEMI